VEAFLQWVRGSRLPVIGVMFYFHTPYYGRDELFLTASERAPIIDRLLACLRAGLPVLNSRAGLRALQSGDWPRRTPAARVADVDGEYVCCRAPDGVCEDCGYALARRSRNPSACAQRAARHAEYCERSGTRRLRFATRCLRRHLVGPEQRWRFEPPAPGWSPPPVERTSLYLHVPFCRNSCPYCPYTKVPYDAALIEPYTRAALVEVDRWADAIDSRRSPASTWAAVRRRMLLRA